MRRHTHRPDFVEPPPPDPHTIYVPVSRQLVAELLEGVTCAGIQLIPDPGAPPGRYTLLMLTDADRPFMPAAPSQLLRRG